MANFWVKFKQINYNFRKNNSNSGKAKLPAIFFTLQLFPAITLFNSDTSIRAKFGREQWIFKQFHNVLASNDDEEIE